MGREIRCTITLLGLLLSSTGAALRKLLAQPIGYMLGLLQAQFHGCEETIFLTTNP